MPLYEYELCDGECKVCGGRFTLRRPVTAPELTKCPACKKPVRKIISLFSTPTKLKPLSIIDAKKAGFTVMKRGEQGGIRAAVKRRAACHLAADGDAWGTRS
jgi:putative FmdB family regulatory protein